MNSKTPLSLAGRTRLWKLALVTTALLGVTIFQGCEEAPTASEPEPATDAVTLMNSPLYVGEGGFEMPNGKYHKEDCPCNICRAIRLNMDSPCIPDTVLTTDSSIVIDTLLSVDSTIILDTLIVTDTVIQIDTLLTVDTVMVFDTVMVVDTVETSLALEGEWLKFSAYEASKAFVLQSYPERAGDRFSSLGTFCDDNANTPAGRAGFRFVDNGDGTYSTAGYLFKYMFGIDGFVWVGQPTEMTFYYSCTLKLGADGSWSLLSVNLTSGGIYTRDTRHD